VSLRTRLPVSDSAPLSTDRLVKTLPGWSVGCTGGLSTEPERQRVSSEIDARAGNTARTRKTKALIAENPRRWRELLAFVGGISPEVGLVPAKGAVDTRRSRVARLNANE
jgi:hypothetical protein